MNRYGVKGSLSYGMQKRLVNVQIPKGASVREDAGENFSIQHCRSSPVMMLAISRSVKWVGRVSALLVSLLMHH